jgi:hypothetical protein
MRRPSTPWIAAIARSGDFWYPDVEAGLHGVYWVEQCVKSADAGSQWVDFNLQ